MTIKTFFKDTLKLNKNKLMDFFYNALKTTMSVLIAYLIVFIIIIAVSKEPSKAIYWFVIGPFSSKMEFGEMIKHSMPLMFSGIAALVIIKAGKFNLFTEGAFYVGGLVAALAAIYIKLPSFLAILVPVLLGGTVSALIGYIPAKLKSSLNVNEFVSSIMLNFIVLWIGVWLISNVAIDVESGDNATKIIPQISKFSTLFRGTNVTTGIVVALLIISCIHFFFSTTRIGYEISLTGDSPRFADYLGINTNKKSIIAQLIGIFIAGVGGSTEILSNYTRFNWKDLPGYGFDGFMITIIAKNKPLFIPLAALFIGYLRAGADLMALNSDVAKEIVTIIQGIIILLIASERFFSSEFSRKLFNKLKRKKEVLNHE